MKNSLKYFGLWQKKRSELPISDDPQTDWQQMRGLLDQHLPVEGGKPSRSKGFKLMSVLFVSMSAAAMTYVVSNVIEIKKHRHDHVFSYREKHRIVAGINSMPNDSIQSQNTAGENKDSLIAAKSSAALPNGGLPNSGLTKSSAAAPVKPFAITSATTATSTTSTTGAGTTKNPGALAGKNSLTAAADRNNNQGKRIYNNSKLLAGYIKGSTLKPGSPHGNGGRYGSGSSPGRANNTTHLLNGSSNGHANRNAVNGTNKTDDAGKVTGRIDSADMLQYPALLSLAPMVGINQHGNAIHAVPITASTINIAAKQTSAGKQPGGKTGKSPKIKNTAIKNSTPSNIDWGLLTGLNSSGSFTPKSQNSNFYGSLPVDLYFGLYGTYHLNDNWGINTQLRLFSPQTITTSYSHANGSKVDSGQLIQVVNSGKFYSVSVPVRATYRVNSNISFVGGPVFNLPVKIINVHSSLLPAGIKADTAYYAKIINLLNGATYLQSFNLGITGGVNFQFKRLSFEASWLRSLSGYQVSSGFGSGRSYNNTIQFTIGFQLSKVRP